MPKLSVQNFELWLRPRDALARLGQMNDTVLKIAIADRILDGRIRLATQSLNMAAGRDVQVPEPVLIDSTHLHGPWTANWEGFWDLGQLSFVRHTTGLEGFANISIVGAKDASGPAEVHVFRGVRLDPDELAREFDLDHPRDASGLVGDTEPPPRNKGGRPSDKHGAPIASITKRLLEMPVGDLQRYTAESSAIDLMDEYRKFGLRPSVDVNARKDAIGILSVVRD
jgi:hypothetical protein